MEIHSSSNYDRRFVELAERAIWGTNGTLYHLQDAAHDLDRLRSPTFLTLKRGGLTVGAVAHSGRVVECGGRRYPAIYQSMLAIDAERVGQGKGVGKALMTQAHRYALKQLGGRGVVYAYVEDGNARSHRILSGLGYQHLGTFHAILFSRVRPRVDARVSKADDLACARVANLLGEQYTQHALVDFERSSLGIACTYVLRDFRSGEIAASVQAVPQRWSIKQLEGLSGKFFVKMLPWVPVLGKIFDPRDFKFLKIGNAYVRHGCEREFFALIESVLALEGRHVAIAFWDKRCPIYRRISRAGSFGLLSGLGQSTARVMACFEGIDEVESADFFDRPLSISPSDA